MATHSPLPAGGARIALESAGEPAHATRDPSAAKTQIASTSSHPACPRSASSTAPGRS